ncbi:hypothetical protein ACHAW5_008694, partial [Stephanodiscus triporus]
SPSHVKQDVEWLYAFDFYCNAFVPLFVLLYVVQFFLLPLVLGTSLLSMGFSNTLYAAAFGYVSISSSGNISGLCLQFCRVSFGLGWNASRIVAYIYFEI